MKIFLAIVAFLIVSVLVYLGFYNAFYSPNFQINKEGGETIVYKTINGRYQLTDSVMKIVFNELYEHNGIVFTKGYGIHEYKPENDKGKMSILFGMYRVYPKLNNYCIKKSYSTEQPIAEIYDRENKKIHYRRRLVKQTISKR